MFDPLFRYKMYRFYSSYPYISKMKNYIPFLILLDFSFILNSSNYNQIKEGVSLLTIPKVNHYSRCCYGIISFRNCRFFFILTNPKLIIKQIDVEMNRC